MIPSFSIVIPTLNRNKALNEFLSVLCEQTFSNWEAIVVDDTELSGGENGLTVSDSRIRYFNREKRLGVSSARNFGAAKARADFLIFIDDDDDVSSSWLSDFHRLAIDQPDAALLFCGMRIVDAFNQTDATYSPEKDRWRFIFPGCWVIRTKLFMELGGYDERLKFGENTELFIRINQYQLISIFTSSVNFIYRPSLDGGSKQIRNRIDSTLITLDKHQRYFRVNKRIKRLLLQVVGVCYLRLGDFDRARICLWQALALYPYRLDTVVRLCISFLPSLSKRIYPLVGVLKNDSSL